MAVLSWLHLSDWHQGGGDFDRKVVAAALLDDIKRREIISPDLAQIDIFFFTGDLAFSGKKEEYEAARQLLLDPTLEALSLTKDRLFIIPGNHDLDRTKFKLLPSALLEPFQTRQQSNEWLEGEEERSELLKPFVAYQKFITEYDAPGFGSYGDYRMVTVKGTQIGILGMSSALMCGRSKEYGFLTVGEPQIHQPLREIETAKVRIALIHHPFEWLAEYDRETIEARLQKGCDFILRGHVHRQAVQIVKGTDGDCVTIPGGTCYNGRLPDRPQYINAYNFVTYDTEIGKGTVYLRRWCLNDTEWTADTDRSKDGKYEFSHRRVKSPPLAACRRELLTACL